jgi:hypothetical protein
MSVSVIVHGSHATGQATRTKVPLTMVMILVGICRRKPTYGTRVSRVPAMAHFIPFAVISGCTSQQTWSFPVAG